MEQKKDEFSLEKYLKESNEREPYPVDITPPGMLRRHCREFYEGSGLEGLVERSKKYACSPLVRSIQSAFL